MKLHLINGFLGAGKTSAIIAATRTFLQQGHKVGIVTNDKGHHLVDTAFFEGEKVPTAELPGGCFRCNFDQFSERIHSLGASAAADVIFAESVGSCVDLVNTVFSPLKTVPGLDLDLITYTVFCDIRLFSLWIQDQPLPFSEHILYTFAKQIEESAIVILNKIDLLSGEEAQRVLKLAEEHFPEKRFLLQNSLQAQGASEWIECLESTPTTTTTGFRVDYRRYSQGERKMAWLDRIFVIDAHKSASACAAAVGLISAFVEALRSARIPIAHLKFYLSNVSRGFKLSFTALDSLQQDAISTWAEGIPVDLLSPLTLLMNARVEAEAPILTALVEDALSQTRRRLEADIRVIEGSAYNPKVLPSPFSA